MADSVRLEDIKRAAAALQGAVHRTPLLSCRSVDEAAGFPALLKAENFQRVGAFKIRGATNWIVRAREEGRDLRGVITFSSGNHGQAVALAARQQGLPAIVVAPESVSRSKLAAMRGYGARVELCGKTSEDRKRRAEELAAETGYAIVPPFDDPWIVAGQWTVALEILEEMPDLRSLVVPVGGAGLISGCALAAKSVSKKVQVFGVEPEAADALARSLEAGKIVSIEPGETIADGLRPSAPGAINFEICRRFVDGVVRVSDAEIARALLFLLERAKILAEPSGAAGLAALLSGKLKPPSPCAVILSGGNVDLAALSSFGTRHVPGTVVF